MPDIARRSTAGLKSLDPTLRPEVLDWAGELRAIWVAAGLSLNQFASLHPIDKGTISRYLNGKRVPYDRWFLDKLLAIHAESGRPVTPAVREHLTSLQLRALQAVHPHEYRIRLVNDELEIALTAKREAERYARALEEQLAERKRQVQKLTDDKGRLRAAWDADRIAMQADYERLTQEIGEITAQVRIAKERAVQAERRCQLLEDVLDHLDAHPFADDDPPFAADEPLKALDGAWPVDMPQVNEMFTEATVTRWLKREGQRVEVGEPLLEVRCDPPEGSIEVGVDTQIPSPAAGILRAIAVAEDETVWIGARLAVIDGYDRLAISSLRPALTATLDRHPPLLLGALPAPVDTQPAERPHPPPTGLLATE